MDDEKRTTTDENTESVNLAAEDAHTETLDTAVLDDNAVYDNDDYFP